MHSSEFSHVEKLAEPLLSAGLTYEYTQTPEQFFGQEEHERLTTNCKVVGHQFTRDVLGVELPTDLQIAEAYLDPDTPTPSFRRVHPTEDLRLGDWILYGRRSGIHPRLITPRFDAGGNMVNWQDLPLNHQAVYLGEHRGRRMVLHATPESGVSIAVHSNIRRSSRTAEVYEVLRLKAIS
ncbi:hypothetical protein BH09PAT4_BH09PAT4_07000 [soil metagenome]